MGRVSEINGVSTRFKVGKDWNMSTRGESGGFIWIRDPGRGIGIVIEKKSDKGYLRCTVMLTALGDPQICIGTRFTLGMN
jgi:hypothetical protein